jgi:formate hydrogenlyase subunit 6/NADH:ubiquinone oxidoreductase subunit I
MMRRPVTAQYPDPKRRLPIDERFMGFPALLWDYSNGESYCTGCMVCVRECPTQCMTADMSDNARFASGESTRKKIIEKFEINLGRCILCGICVDVCNFDAIEMSQEHELSKFERNANRADLKTLLVMGKTWQSQTSWTPTKTKNIGDPDIRARQQADDKAAKAGAVPIEVVSAEVLKSVRADSSGTQPEADTPEEAGS